MGWRSEFWACAECGSVTPAAAIAAVATNSRRFMTREDNGKLRSVSRDSSPLQQRSALRKLGTRECPVGEFQVVTNPVIFLRTRGASSEDSCRLSFNRRSLKV